jgi:mono/diheme cytochrome c family protein
MNRYLKTVATCNIGNIVCVVACLALVIGFLPVGMVEGALQPQASSRMRKVEELFNKNCARCHGSDGRADTQSGHLYQTPDLTDSAWWKKNSRIASTRNLRSIVTRGKGGMPAFGKKLSRSEINLLVDRIRSFRKPERKS